MELKETQEEQSWKKFLRNHWKMVIVAAGAIAGAVIGAVFVFLWVLDWALGTIVPTTLGAWTVGYCFIFFLNILLYEFLIIGLPVIAGVICGYLWYRNLPEEERAEYKEPKKKRSSGGGGAISFVVTIVWLIIVYTDNMWNYPFQNWGLDYLIFSWLIACGWVLLIGGIPALIGGIWWLRREVLKEPA